MSQLGGPWSQLKGPQSQVGGLRGGDERTDGQEISPFYKITGRCPKRSVAYITIYGLDYLKNNFFKSRVTILIRTRQKNRWPLKLWITDSNRIPIPLSVRSRGWWCQNRFWRRRWRYIYSISTVLHSWDERGFRTVVCHLGSRVPTTPHSLMRQRWTFFILQHHPFLPLTPSACSPLYSLLFLFLDRA